MERIHAWPVYNFECTDCGEITEVCSGDFEWNGDGCCDSCEWSCDACGKEYLVIKD